MDVTQAADGERDPPSSLSSHLVRLQAERERVLAQRAALAAQLRAFDAEVQRHRAVVAALAAHLASVADLVADLHAHWHVRCAHYRQCSVSCPPAASGGPRTVA